MKKFIKIIVIIVLLLLLINFYVIVSTKYKIKDIDDDLEEVDAIIVLGAGIRQNKPSPMLEDRLNVAVTLYQNKVAKKILVSGDHEYNNYDEVNVMKDYLKEKGIPSEDIFMDHAGLSTYDSIYRAKKVFKVNKAAIVTQKYHLYRAIYISKILDLKSYGISATKTTYSGQIKRDIREIIARIKDFFKCLIRPEPRYLGEAIPITGNGDKTNDN